MPEGYFGQSRQRLADVLNNGGFTVPGDYFGNAADRLRQRIQPRSRPSKTVILRQWWYAAAALLLVPVLFFLQRQPEAAAPDYSSITSEEIINYVSLYEDINNVPLYELADQSLQNEASAEEELLNHIDEELLLNEL